METILIVITIGIMDILCFYFGAKIGQKAVNNQPIEINPVKAVSRTIDEHKAKKEQDKENEYYESIMYNIDHYDGTSIGQKDIKRK